MAWVETDLDVKRVTSVELDRMFYTYRLHPEERWLIDASTVTSFSADAVSHAVENFVALHRQHGLRLIVAVITSPLVRMGAATAAMSLRALKTPVEIEIVEERAAGVALLRALT